MTKLPHFGSAYPTPLNSLPALRTGLCWSWLVLCCFSCGQKPARAPDDAQGKPWRARPAAAQPAPVGAQVERFAALSSAFIDVISRKSALTSPTQAARDRTLLDSLRQAPKTPTGREIRARILGFASATEESRLHRAVIDARQTARRHNPAFFTQSPETYKQWWLDYHQARRRASGAESY